MLLVSAIAILPPSSANKPSPTALLPSYSILLTCLALLVPHAHTPLLTPISRSSCPPDLSLLSTPMLTIASAYYYENPHLILGLALLLLLMTLALLLILAHSSQPTARTHPILLAYYSPTADI